MNTFQVIVKADTNDGDYVTEISEETEQTLDLERLTRIVKVITDNNGDWHTGDQGDYTEDYAEQIASGEITEGDLEWFDGYVPYGEYGTHSIESVKVQEVLHTINLL